jgi:hypothetical protein
MFGVEGSLEPINYFGIGAGGSSNGSSGSGSKK